MTKVVNDNKEIINPVVYARSENKYEVGDTGTFRSHGYMITGEVQSIRYYEDDRFITHDGCYVYTVCKYTQDEWIGLERTEEEEIEYQKKLDKERQLRLDL